MRRWRLPLVVLALMSAGCTTVTENVTGATEPSANGSTAAAPETATTMSTRPVDAIEPAPDTLVRHQDVNVDKTDPDKTDARGEQPTPVTHEPTATSKPEPLREPHPSIETGSRVNWVDAEALPEWPFDGLIQLAWADGTWWQDEGWQLRFYQWTDSGVARGWTVGEIPLPDLTIDCVGDVGLIFHGSDGIEIGGPAGSVTPSLWVPWGGSPEPLGGPSDKLLAEVQSRPSNVGVQVTGDVVSISHGDESVRFGLHEPPRSEGEWWNVQARHDGDVFVVTVHPTRHPCFSAVTWLSAAATGEMLWCGTSTAATKFITSDARASRPLVLPAAEDYPVVLLCPYPLGPRSH